MTAARDLGVFPDLKHHNPRLLYHRYFMLSEFVNTLENPSTPRGVAEAYAKSYAQHLAYENNAKSVRCICRNGTTSADERGPRRHEALGQAIVRRASAGHIHARGILMRIASMVRQWFAEAGSAWNRFWFEPADPATLGLIRIFARRNAVLYASRLEPGS